MAGKGGIISLVLANVYLHYALDLWFEKVFQRSCKERAFLRSNNRESCHGPSDHSSLAAEASIHEEPGAGKPHAGICAGAVG